MTERALITGGAGFIGSHLADQLLADGYEVRVLDTLEPQTHGDRAQRPAYLDERVEFVRADAGNQASVERALEDVNAVYHFAAAVGVGQSMYEVRRYVDANTAATATLLEAIGRQGVDRLVVASSMSVYGEGSYTDPDGASVTDARRRRAHLREGRWEPLDGGERDLTPVPTPETKPPDLQSVYALTKYDQERLGLIIGEAYGIPTVALRFFNVYGPRQALGNPYTGVLAIFANRILNEKPPLVYEDGHQRRDFVSVHDVARACRLALDAPVDGDGGLVANVGSGDPRSVLDVAQRMLKVMDRKDLEPRVTGEYRSGDIRHCFADIDRARQVLGYAPQVRFEDGVRELVAWLQDQDAEDRTDDARRELEERGLLQ